MIYKYDFIVIVEIQSETEEEQKELRKKFKQELYKQYQQHILYGGNEITRIAEIEKG